jgi:hypothetical protein
VRSEAAAAGSVSPYIAGERSAAARAGVVAASLLVSVYLGPYSEANPICRPGSQAPTTAHPVFWAGPLTLLSKTM